MAGVAVWVRAVLRRRWRATVLLSLVLGVAGAAALGAAAGARRTQTAYPRMRAATNASDLLVSVGGSGLAGFYQAIGREPEVQDIGIIAGIPVGPIDAGSIEDLVVVIAGVDDHALRRIARPNVIEGRMYDPSASDEVFVDPNAARLLKLAVGSRLPVVVFSFQEDGPPTIPPDVVPVTVRVVGIGIGAEQVVPTTPLDREPTMFFTPAFFRSQPSLASRDSLNYDGALVRLRPGTNIPAFERKLNGLAAGFPDTFGAPFIQNQAQAGERTQRAIGPLAVALYLFSGLVGAAILFVLGQAIARQQLVEADDHETLRALGFSRFQLVAASLLRVAVVAVAGALIAVTLSLAVSPFMPIGPARRAELNLGFDVNVAVTGLGAAAIVILILARATLPAFLAATAGNRDQRGTRSFVADAAARAGLAPSAATGIRMAFEQRHGSRSLPLRSALAGTVVGMAALLAALMFGSSLSRLVDVPEAYGQRWDVVADSAFGFFPPEAKIHELSDDPDIAGVTAGNYGSVAIGDRDIPAIGLEAIEGAVYPVILEGEPATKPDEIVLGTSAMRTLGTGVGRSVSVTIAGATAPRPMRVVGRAVFPTMGRGSFAPTSLGDGAAILASNFEEYERSLNPDPGAEPYNFLLIKYRQGADAAAVEKRLRDRFTAAECLETMDCNVTFAQRPIELGVLSQVRSTPIIMAGLLALFAAVTLAHALMTSVRMRSRDLAVLKTIGFVRRQIGATVAWQASALAITALALGVPLGVIAGRTVWSIFATSLGAPTVAVIPVVVVLLTVPATVLLANMIGAFPARAAAKTEVAVVLRTE